MRLLLTIHYENCGIKNTWNDDEESPRIKLLVEGGIASNAFYASI
ncbi:MAG TPA: hypothetical protein VF397_03970 [Pyrinomonadaceae bacterium]